MMVESSPVHSSAGNGKIERGIQCVRGHIRVLRSACEKESGVSRGMRCGRGCSSTRPSSLIAARSGATAAHHMSDVKATGGRIPALAFAEMAMWKRRPVPYALGERSCSWDEGMLVGVKATTGEYIVGNADGVCRTRMLKRTPREERYSLRMLDGVPWRVSESDREADGEAMRMDLPAGLRETLAEGSLARQVAPRHMYIRRQDLDRHEYSDRCHGCNFVLCGGTQQSHSRPCQPRIFGQSAWGTHGPRPMGTS